MTATWLTSNLIPFFADFVSLLGSLESVQLSFVFPVLLFIKLAPGCGRCFFSLLYL